jgi:hypothetical protein
MQRKYGDAPSCKDHMRCCWWRGTCSKSSGKSFIKKWWNTKPVSLLGTTAWPKMSMQTNGNSLLMSWCHSGVGTVAHPHTGIMKVHNTVPCESCFISKQNVSYKLRVYNAFCEMPLAKPHPRTMVRGSEGLHSLDVVWVKWLFMKNSPDKGETYTFSSCNSSHTGSRTFFRSSYMQTSSKLTHISAGIDFWTYVNWVLYPLKACNHFFIILYRWYSSSFLSFTLKI